MSCEQLLSGVTPEAYIAMGAEAREDCPGSLWASGIVRRDPALDLMASGSSCAFTAAMWSMAGTGTGKDSKGAFEAYAEFDCDEFCEAKAERYKMHLVQRRKAWKDEDAKRACNMLAGSLDEQLAGLLSNWTVDVREVDLMAMAMGILADNIANDDGDLVVDADDDTINLSDPGYYSLCAQAELKKKFGCKAGDFGGSIMHIDAAINLEKKGQLTMIAAGSLSTCEASCFEMTGMFSGKPVYAIDNDCLKTADGKYITICFKDGAFGYGEGRAVTPFERNRERCVGSDGAWITDARERYLLHPSGFDFDPILAEGQEYPFPADLANPDNWCRKVNCKNSPLGFIISSEGAPSTERVGDSDQVEKS